MTGAGTQQSGAGIGGAAGPGDRDETIVEVKPATVSAELSRDLRVKWNRFYWGVLETQQIFSIKRHIGDSQRWMLEEQFQAELPVEVETLACAFVPLGGGRVLACGMAHSEVETLLAEAAAGDGVELLSLGPDECPPALRGDIGDAEACSVNLLVGRHEPGDVRRLRAWARRIPMLGAIVAIGLFACGLRIQANRALERTRLLRESVQAELSKRLVQEGENSSLPPTPSLREGASATASTVGNDMASESELERSLARLLVRLQRTHGEKAGSVLPPDAGDAMAAVLRAWPRGVETRTTRLSIGERTASLTIDVPDEKSAETLDGALAGIDGWELLPPQAQRTASGVQVSAMLKPVGTRGGGAP